MYSSYVARVVVRSDALRFDAFNKSERMDSFMVAEKGHYVVISKKRFNILQSMHYQVFYFHS